MDYIEQQLLRQRRALAVLMSGSRPAAESKTAAEELPLAQERSVQGTAAVPVRLRQRSAAGEAVSAPRTDTAVYGPETAQRGVTGFLTAAARTDGADVQAVSRAIQRDARRYDGGFSLY
jgi:hypothetical protein